VFLDSVKPHRVCARFQGLNSGKLKKMKKLALALTTSAVFGGSALAADLPVRGAYTKAPLVDTASGWTGFYVFGGAGGGLWEASNNGIQLPPTTPPLIVATDQKVAGDGWFGTVGLGYDWQFNRSWVVGAFADGQFGSIRGSLTDATAPIQGNETLRNSYAAGVRLGYLVAPNVLSYVSAGYSGSQWSGASLSNSGFNFNGVLAAPGSTTLLGPTTAPSFNRNGWFVGGGIENSLNFFGISAPGWFMKSEYRAAYYGRATLPEVQFVFNGALFNDIVTFKPLVQTASASLVYRFNSGVPTATDVAISRGYAKAPVVGNAQSWTGLYFFGGAGGGLWDANNGASGTLTATGIPATTFLFPDQKSGGDGWFGTVGLGYDWQFDRSWVAGIFADGQFGSIRGSLTDLFPGVEGNETLRNSYAAGIRLGYLVAPNVLSYVNAGYGGSQWSGTTLNPFIVGQTGSTTTPSFNRNGWFVGSGVENSLDIFGISAPGWFMKSEYRAAYYGRATLPEAQFTTGGIVAPSTFADVLTFKPLVQTFSASLVYRFNWGAPIVARY
jgi:outer membrane immunogenic protein